MAERSGCLWPYEPISAHAMRRFAERVDGVQFPPSTAPDAIQLAHAHKNRLINADSLAARMLTPVARALCALGDGRVHVGAVTLVITRGVVITALPRTRPSRAGSKLDHLNKPGRAHIRDQRAHDMARDYA